MEEAKAHQGDYRTYSVNDVDEYGFTIDGFFMCAYPQIRDLQLISGFCIPAVLVMDGANDCDDASDEAL